MDARDPRIPPSGIFLGIVANVEQSERWYNVYWPFTDNADRRSRVKAPGSVILHLCARNGQRHADEWLGKYRSRSIGIWVHWWTSNDTLRNVQAYLLFLTSRTQTTFGSFFFPETRAVRLICIFLLYNCRTTRIISTFSLPLFFSTRLFFAIFIHSDNDHLLQ